MYGAFKWLQRNAYGALVTWGFKWPHHIRCASVIKVNRMTLAFWLKVIRFTAGHRGRKKTWWSPIAIHSSTCPYIPCKTPWQPLFCTSISGAQLQNSQLQRNNHPTYLPPGDICSEHWQSTETSPQQWQNILHLVNSSSHNYSESHPFLCLIIRPYTTDLPSFQKGRNDLRKKFLHLMERWP